METSCSYTDGKAWFSSDERKWCNRIKKLAEQYPEDVIIKRRPEDNDGCIYAVLPSSWFKIQPKFKRQMTDEQRLASAERLRKLRSKTNQDSLKCEENSN